MVSRGRKTILFSGSPDGVCRWHKTAVWPYAGDVAGVARSKFARKGANALITIDYRNGKPIYEQIADAFERLISQGALHSDSQLPSVRQLAVELSINPNTIQKAYTELENRGLTYSVRGRGSFVAAESESLKQRKLQEFYRNLSELIREAALSGISPEEIRSALLAHIKK